jgi:hypothetical protein
MNRRRSGGCLLCGISAMDVCRRSSHRAWLAAAVAVLALLQAGCGTTPPPAEPLGALVDVAFIRDGVTTRGECIQRLGAPSRTMATGTGGEVLTYWLGRDAAGGLRAVVSWAVFEPVRYSLVLSFDAAGVLVRHSMVKVWER